METIPEEFKKELIESLTQIAEKLKTYDRDILYKASDLLSNVKNLIRSNNISEQFSSELDRINEMQLETQNRMKALQELTNALYEGGWDIEPSISRNDNDITEFIRREEINGALTTLLVTNLQTPDLQYQEQRTEEIPSTIESDRKRKKSHDSDINGTVTKPENKKFKLHNYTSEDFTRSENKK